jgi:hypothetical protein
VKEKSKLIVINKNKVTEAFIYKQSVCPFSWSNEWVATHSTKDAFKITNLSNIESISSEDRADCF